MTLYLENANMSLPATQLPTSVPNTALVNWIMLPILAHLPNNVTIFGERPYKEAFSE